MNKNKSIKLPTAVRDQAIILGAKLLPSGDEYSKDIRLAIKAFLGKQGYVYGIWDPTINVIMQMVRCTVTNGKAGN